MTKSRWLVAPLAAAVLLGSSPRTGHACCAVVVTGSDFGALPPAQRTFRIWIEPTSPLFGWRSSFPAAVREALAEWEKASLPVEFVVVTDSTDANLFVFWRERLHKRTSARSTWWTAEGTGYARGEIEIAIWSSDGSFVDHALVRAMAMHEFGHLLGLVHTNDRRSIMARTIGRVGSLSARDVERARTLYTSISRFR